MEGCCKHGGNEINVVDLPGTYSLAAYSVEELVARNFIIDEEPDAVIDVIDASNLERNLYLAIQVMELGVPVVLAFNMTDVAHARGLEFDLEMLSSLLGAPIVSTVGHKGTGTEDLLDIAVRVAHDTRHTPPADIRYGKDIEEAIAAIRRTLNDAVTFANDGEARWTAVKLLENDKEVGGTITSAAVHDTVRLEQDRIESVLGDAAEMIIADRDLVTCQVAVEF